MQSVSLTNRGTTPLSAWRVRFRSRWINGAGSSRDFSAVLQVWQG
jgi:hypothetical protein